MGTFLVFFLALVVIAGLLFLGASLVFGRGEEMAPAPPDSTPVELPDDRPVTGADVRGLRLSMVVRGYRMGEVDWVLDHLARTIDERDALLETRDRELAALRASAGPTVDGSTGEALFRGPLPPVVDDASAGRGTVDLLKERSDG